MPVPAAAAGKKREAQEGAGGEEKARRKRKRRTRLPKGVDPAAPGPLPDPERWLPKWQRSDAKKLRKKQKGKAEVKGSQGAGRVDESLDRTNAPVEEVEAAKGKAPVKLPPGAKGGKKKGKR